MLKTVFQYKVVVYMEGALGSIFLGSSKVDPDKFAQTLNDLGAKGWEVITIEREMRRLFLLFQREALICVLKRSKQIEVPDKPQTGDAA